MDDQQPAFAGPYILGRTLGQGSYSKVKLGTHRKTGKQVAIKILKKRTLVQSPEILRKVEQEIHVLRLINHPNILRLHEVIQTTHLLFLVLEYVPGGELFQLLRKQKLSQETAFKYFHTILLAIEYCHNCCICHRDIKPENILVDEDGSLKVADFGMASMMSDNDMLKTSCGSPHYASPEVIQGLKYDGTKSDIWSLGVLYYGFCAGRLPFNDSNIQKLLQKVCTGKYTVPAAFPELLADFISKMITVPVDQRATIAELKQHPWWLEMCQVCDLSSVGTAPSSPLAPGAAAAAAPLTPVVQLGFSDPCSATLHDVIMEAVDKLSAQMLEDLDQIDDVEVLRRRIRKMASEVEGVQAYALSLEEQLDSSNLKLRTLREAAVRKKKPPVLSGASLQADVEAIPEEVMQVFLGWGWTQEEVNREVLGPGPSLGKALYHLLQHQKMHTGTLPSAQVDKIDVTGVTGVDAPVNTDLLRQLALNKNYTAMELRNPKPGPVLRQFSEGQLLKEKDKSVWSRFFGL